MADEPFDVRDHLNSTETFTLPNDMTVVWSAEDGIAVVIGEVIFPGAYWLDEFGRLEFIATLGENHPSGLDQVEGIIDVLGDDSRTLEYDMFDDEGSKGAAAIQKYNQGPIAIIAAKKCDCSNGINTACITNHCNDEAACTHPDEAYICKWTTQYLFAIELNDDLVE